MYISTRLVIVALFIIANICLIALTLLGPEGFLDKFSIIYLLLINPLFFIYLIQIRKPVIHPVNAEVATKVLNVLLESPLSSIQKAYIENIIANLQE